MYYLSPIFLVMDYPGEGKFMVNILRLIYRYYDS